MNAEELLPGSRLIVRRRAYFQQRFSLATALVIAVLAAPAFARADGIAQQPNSAQLASAVQPRGTLQAGPDGDWIVEPLNGVSYSQLARDRYQCDIWAVDQTGFDPMEDNGGVPPEGVPARRADYRSAEAVCFQARGYIVRASVYAAPRL
jgi:hypothetical protein